jgi:hypothetical protein
MRSWIEVFHHQERGRRTGRDEAEAAARAELARLRAELAAATRERDELRARANLRKEAADA